MNRDVYSGRLRLDGEENGRTLNAASNYSASLVTLERFKEARSMLRKMIPVARRALGEDDITTLRMRTNYAKALWNDDDATLDDLHEAMTTLEDAGRIARRVLGGQHPTTESIERTLRDARAALAARVGDDVSSVCEGVAAMTAKGA